MLLFFIRKLKVFDVKNSYSNKNYLKPLFPRSLQKCPKKKKELPVIRYNPILQLCYS